MNFKRPIIFDGAFGTTLEAKLNGHNVPRFECNEELNLIAPDIVKSVHLDFLNAGAQVVETNTFGANRIVLSEHGLADKIREINLAAVKIAKKAAGPLFVSASIGPTSKLPTLGHISFSDMVAVYKEQAGYLFKAGVDMFQIETCQDILQAKAAVIGCRSAFSGSKGVPIIVTITVEPSGVTLLGTEVGAALAALAPLGISAFGLNCATGPAEMEEHVRYLCKNSPLPIAVLANAGLPEIKNGVARYPLTPEEFGEWAEYFVRKLGVRIIGGCCGTTPEHIAAIRKKLALGKVSAKARALARPRAEFVSSLYTAVPIDQEPKPLIVGERMNINGSKEFRERLLAGDLDAAAAMSKKQAVGGAHILDLSVAYAGRDEVRDMQEMTSRLATVSPLPIMIDSTDPDAIEAALERLGGRSIINSINLEDGGKKAQRIIDIAKRYGSAIVGLTIDKDGMARTAKKKLGIAKKLIRLCKGRTLFIDLLTFTLADPKAAEFGSGLETLKALRALKRSSKNARTILGVSNISYGLRPEARKVLNSIFLHEAVRSGLDAAIVHAGQILPVHKIDKRLVRLAMDLIHCRKKDALARFIEAFEDKVAEVSKGRGVILSDEKLLEKKILDGDKESLAEILEKTLKKRTAPDIINGLLMPAMKKVGDLFGSGDMVLPFVLQSAETMRFAVDVLAPFMGRTKVNERGRMVLATVRGDVHDIGKNLVDIILSNNGYKVINLGVKQPIGNIIRAVESENASAIGLSGLLVQSCIIMKDDIAELAHRGYRIPVICGGAALTRKYVENDLQKAYQGKVYYAKDAFDGLRIMQEICG